MMIKQELKQLRYDFEEGRVNMHEYRRRRSMLIDQFVESMARPAQQKTHSPGDSRKADDMQKASGTISTVSLVLTGLLILGALVVFVFSTRANA